MNRGDVEALNRDFDERLGKRLENMVVTPVDMSSTEDELRNDLRRVVHDKCNGCSRYQSGCLIDEHNRCLVAQIMIKWNIRRR